MKKSRKILLIMAFVVLLGLIHMPNKAFAAGEVYSIRGNGPGSINLVLGEHENEQLKALDNQLNEIDNANVEWTSSDDSIVSVSSSGLITAKKEGTATITATTGTESKSVEVEVSSITFADFSDVEYKWKEAAEYYLQVCSDKAYENRPIQSQFYYLVTSDKEKPSVAFKEDGGGVDTLNSRMG